MSLILTEIRDRIGYISLNRPEKRNALSPKLVASLKDAFLSFRDTDSVKVVVLSATGKAFCAGADLAYLQQLQGYSKEENIEDSNSLSELFRLIYEFPKIVIASVQGHAIAGGCGLASVCDFILTVPEAKFGYTEVRIGFVPAIVSYFLIKKIGEAKAREYLLSGDLYNATDFIRSGLIYQIAKDQAELDQKVEQLASRFINQNSADSMTLTKSLLANIGSMELDQAMDYASNINADARSTDDCIKGIGAFLSGESLSW
jgi:methylglutaconyl-CoA hydratase